jgi:hypothetical protein
MKPPMRRPLDSTTDESDMMGAFLWYFCIIGCTSFMVMLPLLWVLGQMLGVFQAA